MKWKARLPYRPPLDWAAIIRFLAARATPGVEVVRDDSYRRTVEVDGVRGEIELRPGAGARHLLLRVRLPGCASLHRIVERVRRMFGLDADPHRIGSHLRQSPRLAAMVDALPGLRVPGAWDAFELAVRAVLGQQVTVRAATTLAGRLVQAYGAPVEGLGVGLSHLFPPPATLAEADVAALGMPRTRAATIRALAAAVSRGELVLDAAGGLNHAVARLCAIPGVGPWTAHYIAMRAFGEPDAFPATDLGLRRALAGGRGPLHATEVLRLAEAWRPWRAYAAMYLWAAGPSPAARRDLEEGSS